MRHAHAHGQRKARAWQAGTADPAIAHDASHTRAWARANRQRHARAQHAEAARLAAAHATPRIHAAHASELVDQKRDFG